MATSRIDNQAVKIYSPTETLFNNNTDCRIWHNDHFNLVTCDDVTEIVLDTLVENENVQVDGGFEFEEQGLNTSTGAFLLINSGATFLSSISIGMIVRIIPDEYAVVLEVLSDTNLLLDADIMTSSSTAYSISHYYLSGNMFFGTSLVTTTAFGAAAVKQKEILTEGNLYKMQIDVLSFSSQTNGDQLVLKIGGNTVLTLDETNSPSGTLTAYGYASGGFPSEVEFSVEAGITASFSNLKVDLLSTAAFFVLNCDDNTLCYTSLISDFQTSSTIGQMKLSFDWSNLQDGYTCNGCKYMVIIDDVGLPDNINTDKINDGDFQAAGWNLGTGWTLTGLTASIDQVGVGAGALTQTILATNFSKSFSYDVQFTISGYVTGSFDVKLFNGVTEVAYLGNVSSDGIHVLSTGVLSSNCDTIKFIPNSSFTQDYDISAISALINISDTGFDWTTDCFELADSHDCTITLAGTNADNAFGIDFVGLAYSPSIRLKGQLETPKYKGDKENEEDSSGISKTLYFKSEKERSLFIWQQPEYVHDFIRLLKGYDTFQVDGVNYLSLDADYEPESSRVLGRIPDLSNASTGVRLKTDLNENKFC